MPTYPGLTDREATVLEALFELGEALAEEVARRSGVRGDDLIAALDRLVGLGYAARRDEDNAIYRPVARSPR